MYSVRPSFARQGLQLWSLWRLATELVDGAKPILRLVEKSERYGKEGKF